MQRIITHIVPMERKIKNISAICLFIVLVLSVYKTKAQYSINSPSWIESLPEKEGFIYATGNGLNDSSAIVEAKTNLCAYFQTNVSDVYKGNAGSIMKYDADEGKIDREFKYDLFKTFIWSSNRLSGVRIISSWVSPEGMHYKLVEINLAEHYKAQQKDKLRIISFINAAENNQDPGIKLRNYITAIALTTTILDTVSYKHNELALIYCINQVAKILNNVEVCGGTVRQANASKYYTICLRYNNRAISNTPFYFDVFNTVAYSNNSGLFAFNPDDLNQRKASIMSIKISSEDLKLPLPDDISPEEKVRAINFVKTVIDIPIVHTLAILRNSVAIVSKSFVNGESCSAHKINRKMENFFSTYNINIVEPQNADIIISTIIDTDFSSKINDLFCYKSESVVVVTDNNGHKIETIDFSGMAIREKTKRLSTVESKAINESREDMIDIIINALKEKKYFDNNNNCCE